MDPVDGRPVSRGCAPEKAWVKFGRGRTLVALALAGAIMSGCQTGSYDGVDAMDAQPDDYSYGTVRPADTKYFASDEPLKEGVRQFQAGNFGLAQKHFQAAVEKTPRDAAAWLGLAASYDRLRRFDLADKAYDKAIGLRGRTVQILNNQGYSHLLRGDLAGARRFFLAAYEIEPENPTVLNNLKLLSNSGRMVERHMGAY
jgi:tetratricopeptide (TPR) repeat protein